MKYMLDTNICIYLIKKKPIEVLKKFEKLTIGDICISSVTLSELTYGAHKSQRKESNLEALEEFTIPLEIAKYDENAAYIYGSLRANLEKKGTPIGSMDLLIAAHAMSLNITLVTHNVKEFTRVSKLSVESWIVTDQPPA